MAALLSIPIISYVGVSKSDVKCANSHYSERQSVQRNTQVPIGKRNNRQHASPDHEVDTDVKQMPILPIIILLDELRVNAGLINSWVEVVILRNW